MFVNCSKCTKIFNYDKYSGVCPHCGRYNRILTAEDEHQTLHQQYDTETEPHRENAGKKEIKGWMWLLLIFAPGLMVFLLFVRLLYGSKKS